MFSTRWETNVSFTTAILLFTCIGAYSVLLNVARTASVLRWLRSHPFPVDIRNAFGRPTTYHRKARDYSLLIFFFPPRPPGSAVSRYFDEQARSTSRFTIFLQASEDSPSWQTRMRHPTSTLPFFMMIDTDELPRYEYLRSFIRSSRSYHGTLFYVP